MHNNHWGTTLLGAILLLLLAGGLYTWHTVRETQHKVEQDVLAEQARKDKAEFNLELRQFAESNPDLKVVQELIDELEQEIQLRGKKLNQLAIEMRRASRVPESDTDYSRWSRAIIDLQKKLNALLAERKETWLEWKKVENNPDKSPELAKIRDDRIKKARKLAESTRSDFNDLRNANRPDEPITVPEPEKKPEKTPRKKWLGIF